MDTLFRFLYEFLSQFFGGIFTIFSAIINAFRQMFNFRAYLKIIEFYKNDFKGPEWLFVGLFIISLLVIVLGFAFLIIMIIKKYVRFRKTLVEQEELLNEVSKLNDEVSSLVKEKEDILAMKVSHLGLKPGEDETEVQEDEKPSGDGFRFAKLKSLDDSYADYKIKNYNDNFTLPELVELFRNFAASQLKLYYKSEMVRIFLSGLASTKLIILQGISGTGKTSLAYAWGKFVNNDSCIASVQPSWRDRTEFFGYLNEFTKKFNETEVLAEMYKAGYTDDVYTMVLDEMNIARVEYYFAEFLSLLEYHSEEERVLEITNDVWNSDPKKLIEGRLPIGHNVYFIGTANNDESTFAISDKVYDRSMIINLNKKAERFYADEGHPIHISNKDFMYLANEARINFSSTDETKVRKDIEILNSILLQTLRISFGNRMVKQILDYIPVYEACGGTKEEAFDDFVSKKILRKIEGLDFIQLRDSIGTCLEKINQNFKKGELTESKEYLAKFVK